MAGGWSFEGAKPGRKCGPCTLCCTVPDIKELEKPHNVTCPNCTRAGCGIYDARPEVCRGFVCNWLAGHGDEAMRPDRVGFYTTCASGPNPDQDPALEGIKIHLPAGSDMERWKRYAFMRKTVMALVERGHSVWIICGDLRRILTNSPKILAAIAEDPSQVTPEGTTLV
jgi:hypothetical protein